MEDLKDCGKELKVLSIYNTKVQQLDPGFWRSIAGIQTVELVRIALTEASFCAAANGTVWNVTTLNLMNNQLTVVKTHQFVCTPLLEQLLLHKNAITTLEPEAFSGLRHLKILKLNLNRIKILAANDFQSLHSLEVLLLDENVIERIEDGVFRNQKELRELTFGRLEYVYVLYLNFLLYGLPENLQHLSIDAYVGTTLCLGNIGRPKKSFKFELNGDQLTLGDNYPPFLESVREFKLSGITFYFRNDFFVPYFSHLESLELTANPEQTALNYTEISKLRYLKRLKLINLNFLNFPDPSITFWNLDRLQILVLYNCRLNFLTKAMFRDLHSLELLHLYSENPLILQDGMFDAMPVLKAVVIERVVFRCDCQTDWFLEWAQNTRTKVINLPEQECVWHYQKLNLLSTMEKLCQTDRQYLCYLGTVNLISLLLVSALSYRFAYWPCMVLIFRLRGYMERKFGKAWRRRRQRHRGDELEAEEDVKYDAFVSFSHRNEAWVLEELAPRLEEQGQPRLRLCLHNRDFESLSEWQCLSEVKMGRGSPIPPMLRRKIVEQYQKGVSQRKIAKSLKLSSSTVHNIIQRFRESGTISVRKGQGRKTILDARDLRALRRHCITYRNATVMEITTWAQKYFQKTLSVSTIHRAIRRCQLKLYRSKKKPYLNMIQKRRRFLWAKAHLKWTVAKWKTVLWSDESKFEVLFGKLGRHVIRTKEDKDSPSCYQCSLQKPASLMVWGCMSACGMGSLHIWKGTINAESLAKLVKSHTYLDWPQDEAERTHFWERLRRNIAEGEMVRLFTSFHTPIVLLPHMDISMI
ncbi:hypothetical protein QTP86_020594 [Hemibagrus guttatus]|nr:hypothetical protein QTP86_020594 [Hemibagrus guttatus]